MFSPGSNKSVRSTVRLWLRTGCARLVSHRMRELQSPNTRCQKSEQPLLLTQPSERPLMDFISASPGH